MISHDSLIFVTGVFGGAWTMLVGLSVLWRRQVHRPPHVSLAEYDPRATRPRQHEIPVVIDMRGKQSAARHVLGVWASAGERLQQLRIHVAHRKHAAVQCQACAQSSRCGSAGAGGSAVDCHGSGEIGGARE